MSVYSYRANLGIAFVPISGTARLPSTVFGRNGDSTVHRLCPFLWLHKIRFIGHTHPHALLRRMGYVSFVGKVSHTNPCAVIFITFIITSLCHPPLFTSFKSIFCLASWGVTFAFVFVSCERTLTWNVTCLWHFQVLLTLMSSGEDFFFWTLLC